MRRHSRHVLMLGAIKMRRNNMLLLLLLLFYSNDKIKSGILVCL